MTSAATGERPVLVFDGDCALCTTLASFVQRRMGPRYRIAPWQRLDLGSLGLTAEECATALQYVDAEGQVFAAQDAVARLLLASAVWWRPLGAVLLVPGVRWVAGVVYRWVARNRSSLPGGTPACALPSTAAAPGRGSGPDSDGSERS
jgi:predicted DCC family thiol-disulfide oxidoreductase YuxK